MCFVRDALRSGIDIGHIAVGALDRQRDVVIAFISDVERVRLDHVRSLAPFATIHEHQDAVQLNQSETYVVEELTYFN